MHQGGGGGGGGKGLASPVPFSIFLGSRFPDQVANPKKGALIAYGYWATRGGGGVFGLRGLQQKASRAQEPLPFGLVMVH